MLKENTRMITTESAPERLSVLLSAIKSNAVCYDRIAECREAYKERQVHSRHYQGNLLADLPCSVHWLWTAFSDSVERTAQMNPITEVHLSELADRTTGIAANARALIAHLSDQFMHEQPLNSLIGDLDGLHRIADTLLNDLRQEQAKA